MIPSCSLTPGLLWSLCGVAAGCSVQAAGGTPEAADPEPEARPAVRVAGAAFEHLEVLTGGAEAGDRLPMIVALHGYGQRPHWWVAHLRGFRRRARVIVPRAPEVHPPGFGWFPFETTTDVVARRAHELARAFTIWRARRPTRGRPMVVGFSQGSALAFALAVRHPRSVAAAYPIGGTLPVSMIPRFAPSPTVPLPRIRSMHGTADPMMGIEQARADVNALRDRGYPADPLLELRGVEHTITPAMRDQLHAWLAEDLP